MSSLFFFERMAEHGITVLFCSVVVTSSYHQEEGTFFTTLPVPGGGSVAGVFPHLMSACEEGCGCNLVKSHRKTHSGSDKMNPCMNPRSSTFRVWYQILLEFCSSDLNFRLLILQFLSISIRASFLVTCFLLTIYLLASVLLFLTSLYEQDFYNLMNVYLDAVFFPRAVKDPQVMQQEGWHYELEDKNDPLTYKGVVFNEMKGVYSSPDSLHGRTCQQVKSFPPS